MDGTQLDQSQMVIKKPKVIEVPIESSSIANSLQSKVEPGKGTETVTCKFFADSARSKEVAGSATTLEESALAIDHIRETIFSQLDKKTLFNCRPVCHRWQFFSAKQLQKTTTLKFTEEQWWVQDEHASLENNQYPAFVFNRNCRCTVRDLTNLMDNSIVANTEFPCTSFEFNCAGKISPVLESFFQNHGPQLKKLEFFRDTSSHCFQGLTNILIHATNLEYFAHHPGAETSVVRPGIGSKSVSSSDEDDGDDSTDDDEDTVKEYNERGEEIAQAQAQTQVQLPKIPSKGNLISNPNPNLMKLNLKVIKFTHTISRFIFQEFVDTSPNLTEVSLVTENLEFLLKPVNRLHLLKTLKTEVKSGNIGALESLATAIHTQNNGKSAIEYLDLLILDKEIDLGGWEVIVSRDMLERFGKVCSQILAGSSASCKRLKWYPMRYLDGFQIPVTPMPNVTTLELVYYSRRGDVRMVRRGRALRPTQFFHDRIVLEDVFPNLKYVSIQSKVRCFGVPITNLFDNFNLKPVLTVTKVTSALVRCGNYLECFQGMFPNAVITEGLRLT